MNRIRLIETFAVLSLSVLLSWGCASGPKARTFETENGRSAAMGAAETESEATLAALDQATEHCTQQGKRPVFDDRVLAPTEKKDPEVDLRKLPVIGAVFKDQGKTTVTLQYRCS